MYKDGKQYDKFILNGKTYDKFYLNNKQYGGGYVPFATPILDLDFQNNFIDNSPSALNMVQGQGLPTFELSGRKPGEYCANFNGSQSIKTTTNLPLNSDKVCVKFWMKTTQTNAAIIYELSGNTNINYAFSAYVNDSVGSSLQLNSNGPGINKSVTNGVNNGAWLHIVGVYDRNLGPYEEVKIYANGVLNFGKIDVSNTSGNFVNDILYIGQRGGSVAGFVGSLMKFQIFNGVPTDAQAMEMYQNDL